MHSQCVRSSAQCLWCHTRFLRGDVDRNAISGAIQIELVQILQVGRFEKGPPHVGTSLTLALGPRGPFFFRLAVGGSLHGEKGPRTVAALCCMRCLVDPAALTLGMESGVRVAAVQAGGFSAHGDEDSLIITWQWEC